MSNEIANRASAQTDETSAGSEGEGLSREIIVLGAVFVLGAIMTVLDLTIVNMAVPTIGRELGASISSIQWVMTGYMLAFASVIPLTGWASERFGAKRVWTCSLLLFHARLGLGGAAWSTGSLIAFRVLQGIGACMIIPVRQTILAQAAGPQRMGRVMSLVGVPMLLGGRLRCFVTGHSCSFSTSGSPCSIGSATAPSDSSVRTAAYWDSTRSQCRSTAGA
jgi:MFS family permease